MFMNLFTPYGPYENLRVILTHANEDDVSGIFRHLEAIDRPLDQTTNVSLVESFNPNSGGINRWFSADFQMGYDPCNCGSNKQFQFLMNGMDTLQLSLFGRALATDLSLAENGQPGYDEDWLSVHDVNNGLSGGNRIYSKFDGLIEDYKQDLTEYEQLSSQYQNYQERKMWLDAFKNVVVEGAAGFIPGAGTLTNWYLKPKQNDTTGTATSSGLAFAKGNGKGLLGLGYDLLSSEIATGSSQPKPPTMPVASYTEMRFSGKVTSISEPTIVGPFYIPGAFDESGLTGNLTPFNYPAYNEPMGMAALLNTPSAVIQFSENTNTSFNTGNQDGCPSDVDTEIIMTFDLKMKLDEELMTVLNHTLDFDMDRTATYVGFEVDVKVPDNPMPNLGAFTGLTDYEVSESEQNMFVNLDFRQNGDRVLKYSSKWIPLDIVNQYVYSIKREEIFNFSEWANQPPAGSNCNEPNSSNHYSFDFDYIIERVKLKVVHDMYFDQIGSNGDQVNQLQIFTYDVYNPSENINLFNTSPTNWDQVSPGQFGLYQPGILELNNQIIGPSSDVVTELDNGILYVRAEEINVTGFVQVQNGYKLKLEALSQVRLSPEAPGHVGMTLLLPSLIHLGS